MKQDNYKVEEEEEAAEENREKNMKVERKEETVSRGVWAIKPALTM